MKYKRVMQLDYWDWNRNELGSWYRY